MKNGYEAWLGFPAALSESYQNKVAAAAKSIVTTEKDTVVETAVQELSRALAHLFGERPRMERDASAGCFALGTFHGDNPVIGRMFGMEAPPVTGQEGYAIRIDPNTDTIAVGAEAPEGLLYGVFHVIRLLALGEPIADTVEQPLNRLRMIDQWDNIDGSIERGYAGHSIFYADNQIVEERERIRDYARLLASTGINAIAINNVNVHRYETLFLTERYLPDIAKLAELFRSYGIKLFLSINFAAPMDIDGLPSADPLDPQVRKWWRDRAAALYEHIPQFGGFLVKADSEGRPGPFTYGRDHADGANMLGEALEPYGGLVIWRCFVYNCTQDWRDRSTDRARAAYDHFTPLDGKFRDNVVLQVKNGPMDFQVREPVSPLFGAMERTNLMIEFQITQEYTGQQRHLCYLVPQWKEILEFETYSQGEGSPIKNVVNGTLNKRPLGGIAAVSNIGNQMNWTGHLLAQANLYGYGRLAWNPEISAESIAEEWAKLTFGAEPVVVDTLGRMLLESWSIYESYTAPLGVGWMVNPDHHYGPNVDGYEYSRWGTYHFADCDGIGVDRTIATGTGYAGQYKGENRSRYESLAQCPDELLLFFHHVSYRHVLRSGKTVIQHIYDSHFDGAERAEHLLQAWNRLSGLIDVGLHAQVRAKLEEQAAHSKEWRDRINTYFYRKSGIADERGRLIY